LSAIRESTVTVKGQTTLPRDVRRALELSPGDRVRYLILENGEVRILRIRPVAEMAGILARKEQPIVSLEDMEKAIVAGALGEP
jgi:antitoxin PrlF